MVSRMEVGWRGGGGPHGLGLSFTHSSNIRTLNGIFTLEIKPVLPIKTR